VRAHRCDYCTDGGKAVLNTSSTTGDLGAFESHRALLVAHAYRMLGDLGRAEDMVQEAWLRWSGRQVDVEVASPRAYLITLVTRLCFNELDSAKTRREESRGDRLPEPVDLDQGGIGRVELLDQVSMAFLVVLQRLTPAERAVLLLRDVFDFDYKEIAALVGKTEPACRKLLERARRNVATEKRLFAASPEAHRRLLAAFTQAASAGDLDALVAMLAEDAVLITDGGPEGRRVGGIRNLQAPLTGAARIAAFVSATARISDLEAEIHELNGQPALVFYDQDTPFAALLLAVADDRIHRVFFHADLRRLRYLGPRTSRS
jgi:RNA polymerase sigma-70 factor (ECF subfamily)